MRVPLRSLPATVLAAGTTAALLVAAGPTQAAPVAASTPAAVTHTVRLVTGDSVTVSTAPGGRTAVQLAPARPGTGFSQWSLGGRAYVVPTAAQPYLGRILDPELFDVSSPTASGTRVDVDLAFTAGSRPAVPGFTAVSSTATSMHGYVDAAGGVTFGAALLDAYHHDAVPGAAPAPTLFGATRITRSDSAPGTAQPAFPQVTLVIRLLDATGAPAAFGVVGLINLDDPRRYGNFVFVSGGEARVSVPKGAYGLVTDVSSFDPVTFTASDAIVSVPELAVTTNLQRVVLDARTATARPSVETPQPGGLIGLTVDYERLVGGQAALSFSTSVGPGSTVALAPAPAPRIGSVELLTSWQLGSTPTRGLPYRYDAAFDDSGAIDADQHHVVTSSQLAVLSSRYGGEGYPGTAVFGRTPVYPFQFFIFSLLEPQPTPLSRTEYVTAPPSVSWFNTYVADANSFNGIVEDGLRVYPAGSRQNVDWLRGPLAPGVVGPASGDTAFLSTACRTSDDVSLVLAPFTDSTPGHAGYLSAFDPTVPLETFVLRRDGTLVARRTGTGSFVTVPPGAATYEATVETFAGNTGFGVSTHAVTTLTFRSGAGTGAPLPDGWSCLASNRSVTTDATVLPVLTATVPLPTDVAGVMPLGANTFTFTVAPQAGAAPATVVGTTLAVSTDNGGTFTDVPVTPLGANRFRATITHPVADAGRSVTLRLSGHTADGSAITETVDNVYTVAGS